MPEQTLPAPRTPDPMEAPPVRWGILGPGNIAHAFATALREGTRQEVVAVGSRSAAARPRLRRRVRRAHGIRHV